MREEKERKGKLEFVKQIFPYVIRFIMS